jgi:hypothetical protein
MRSLIPFGVLALGLAACADPSPKPNRSVPVPQTRPETPSGRNLGSFTLEVDPVTRSVRVSQTGFESSGRGLHVGANLVQPRPQPEPAREL